MNLNPTVKLFGRLWENEVRKEYEEGLIPTEACLQAALYHHIRRNDPCGVQVFVEIKTFLDHPGIPDLIIARNRHIDAVIELKLRKNNGIVYERDVDKLVEWVLLVARTIAKGKKASDTLRLDPYKMQYRPHREAENQFILDDRTAWIFAAIGKYYCDGLDRGVVRQRISMRLKKSGVRRPFRRCFLHCTGTVYKAPKRIEFAANPIS